MSRVLIIGSGAREHALAWKLSSSPSVSGVIVAPGNDGMRLNQPGSSWEYWPADLGGGAHEFERLARLAKSSQVGLVVVGPDNPLADGIVDVFNRHGVPCFGPTAAAARLESSKAFAKEIMNAAGVPTARFEVLRSKEEVEAFFRSSHEQTHWRSGFVVKADGLALGKGVRVCRDAKEAMSAARELLPISGSLVVEERLEGEEVSWMAFCDGQRASLLDTARDYKRVGNGDQGPNTGGMGAYSPVPGIAARLGTRVRELVFAPVLREMEHRGVPFRGLLYAGLMIQGDQFWVLEFNARFGDPETQVLLPRMNADLYSWCLASAQGNLVSFPEQVPFSDQSAVYVVGAARGYPERPEKGARITLEKSAGSESIPRHFWAGVKRDQTGALEVSGGRVMGALGMGVNLSDAAQEAYAHLSQVKWEGMTYRTDIAGGAS